MIYSLFCDVKEHIAEGQNVIILGDFNEGIHSQEKMSQKFFNAGLFNLMETRLDTKTLPRTHSRGSKAIDHIWVTKHIADNSTRAGYAPFFHILDSDHRGLFFDIPESALFDADSLKIVHHEFRRLKSNNHNRKKKYMKTLTKGWEHHKIDKKIPHYSKFVRL